MTYIVRCPLFKGDGSTDVRRTTIDAAVDVLPRAEASCSFTASRKHAHTIHKLPSVGHAGAVRSDSTREDANVRVD